MATGAETAFPGLGVKFDGRGGPGLFAVLKRQADGMRSEREFSDDTSTTVLMGTSDAPIPWTKPQELQFNEMLPALGMKGSFAAPYTSSQGKYALFLFGDFHISAVSGSLHQN